MALRQQGIEFVELCLNCVVVSKARSALHLANDREKRAVCTLRRTEIPEDRGGGYGLFQGCAAGDTSMAVVLEVQAAIGHFANYVYEYLHSVDQRGGSP